MINNDWIKDLKPGDKVVYDAGRFGREDYAMTEVTKITPTGIIKTSDGKAWNLNGDERKTRTAWDNCLWLKPLTQEILDKIEKQEILKFIDKASFKSLPLESLRIIANIIKHSTPQ